jgi:hypothetical protein
MDWLLSKQVSWRTVLLSVGFAVGWAGTVMLSDVCQHTPQQQDATKVHFVLLFGKTMLLHAASLLQPRWFSLPWRSAIGATYATASIVPWMLPASMQQCLQDNSYMRLLQCLAGCSRFWLDDVRLPDLDCDLGCVQ